MAKKLITLSKSGEIGAGMQEATNLPELLS